MAENEMRPGMNPRPPVLWREPADEPAEQFWVIKHGIKMTGMPAWGVTHSDQEIWNMVAFLQILPSLSPQRYRALTMEAAGHHDHDHMNMEK
jgi:mono/diheme cytochrome c family protein